MKKSDLEKHKHKLFMLRKRKSALKNSLKNIKGVSFSNNEIQIPKYFEYKSNDKRLKVCSIKYKYTNESIKDANKQVEETKKKNNKLLSLIFILLNIAIITVVLIMNGGQEDASFGEIVNAIKWPFILLALAMFILALIMETTKYALLIYQSTRRFRPYLSFKLMVLGKYYDHLTPFGSGEQPFQIYYLNKRGLKAEVSTSIPLMKYIYWQIAFVLTASVLLIKNYAFYANLNPIIVTLGWVGLAINTVILCTVLLLSTSKRFGPKIVIGVLKLLHKLKVIKDYQAAFRKTMRFVMNYQRCMRAFATNVFYNIVQVAIAVAEILLTASIAYYIYLSLVEVGDATAMQVISMVILCNLAVGILPLPGGTGVAEFSFIAIYSQLFANAGIASWATLMYRIFTYYFILALGIGVIFYDFLIGNKKAEKYRQVHIFKDGFIFKDQWKKMKEKRKEKKQNKKNLNNQLENVKENEIDEQRTIENQKVVINGNSNKNKSKEKIKTSINSNSTKSKTTKNSNKKKPQ